MTESHANGWRRPAIPLLAAALLMAACSEPDPGHGERADAETTRVDSRTARLQCMPTTLVSLALPLEEGLAAPLDAPSVTPAIADCVRSLFGGGALKSPVAFDHAYGRVFAYHEEHGALAVHALPREGLQLFRLGSTAGANVWLLRVDAGMALEDAHYDAILSTALADGALVDHLLVGVMGLLYRRDYDIDAVDAFSIREDTGRGADAGPGYRARYRILDDGRFSLVSGEVSPAPAATEAPADAAP